MCVGFVLIPSLQRVLSEAAFNFWEKFCRIATSGRIQSFCAPADHNGLFEIRVHVGIGNIRYCHLVAFPGEMVPERLYSSFVGVPFDDVVSPTLELAMIEAQTMLPRPNSGIYGGPG
jgi:hypothetical protein